MTTNELRVKLLSKKTVKIEKMYVEEWEEEIFVKGLNSREVMNFSSVNGETITAEEGFSEFLKMIILSVVDENGKRVFSEADMEALSEQSLGVIQEIAMKAMELSGLTKKAEKN